MKKGIRTQRVSDRTINSYEKADLNSKIHVFEPGRMEMGGFYKSIQYFFTKDYIEPGDSFLDVGGAGGNLVNAINTEVTKIRPTVIDCDPKCIEHGRLKYPDFEFICGIFPEAIKGDRKFDIVSMQALFPIFLIGRRRCYLLKNTQKNS